MPASPNGGTTEYANIIGGISSVDTKVTEQQQLLNEQFSHKIQNSEINEPITEGNNQLNAFDQLTTLSLPLIGGVAVAGGTVFSPAKQSADYLLSMARLQASMTNMTGVAATTKVATTTVVETAAPIIARGGIGGLATAGGKFFMLFGRVFGILGSVASLAFQIWDTFSTIGKFSAQHASQIASLEVELGQEKQKTRRLQTSMARMEQKMNRIETTLEQLPDKVTSRIERPGGKMDTGFNGIGGKIDTGFKDVKDKFKKLFDWLPLGEIFSALAFIVSLHNATMLSSNLLQTLGTIVDTGLDVLGMKSPEGESFNISEILGKKASEVMKSLLGEATWTNVQNDFKLANRMYQATANVTNSIQSIIDSTRSIMELGAENTGKIGNALKAAGVVWEKAYDWMPENVSAATAKMSALNKISSVIQEVDNTAGVVSSAVSEVKSIQDTAKEIKDQQEKWNTDKNALIASVTTQASNSKGASTNESVAPAITKADLKAPAEAE